MKRSIAMSWCAGLAVVLMAAPLSAQTTVQGPRRWWRRGGYRVITVYSDGERFYRRPFGRTVLRKVVVYERGGRYYINDDQWRWHRDYHDRYVRGDRRDNDRD